MKKKFKSFGIKSLAALLSVIMMLTTLPLAAFAIDFESGTSSADQSSTDQSHELIAEAFEVKELREESVKHFRLEDGSYVATQYEVPVHYLDSNGEWQDIDNSLSDIGSEYSTSSARIKFAKKITGNESLFTLHDGNRKITMSLNEARKKTVGKITNIHTEFDESTAKLQKMMTLDKLSSKIMYEDILDGVDLEYVADSVNIKENIIVKEKKDSYSYTFKIKLNNLDAKLNEDGSVTFFDPDTQESVYYVPAPVVYDAKNNYASSNDAYYTLIKSGNNIYSLTVSATSDWMNAEERAFPVVIDPAIYTKPSETMTDSYVDSQNPNSTYYTFSFLAAGHGGGGQEFISYLKMNTLPTLPADAYINSVNLELYCQDFRNHDTSLKNVTIGAYNVTSDWASGLTWNTYSNGTKGKISDMLDYVVVDASSETKYMRWDITSLYKQWIAGTANYGIALKTTDSGKVDALFTSENATSNRPRLVVQYRDMKGLESYWSYSNQNAGIAGTGYVNHATGTLTLAKSLLSTTDSLFPYTPTITYNSAIAGKPYQYPNVQAGYATSYMPYGFKLNINETIIEKKYVNEKGSEVSYYIWTDADGTEHYFYSVNGSTSEYEDEDGLQLKLKIFSSSCTITDDSKTVRTFYKINSVPNNEVCNGWYLINIADKSGNKISFSFDGSYRPTGVRLTPKGIPHINYLTMAYNSSSMLYIIWNQTTKEAIILRYSSTPTGSISTSSTKYLREIIYAHGNSNVTATDWLNFYNDISNTTNITVDGKASYTYNSSGRITKIKDELSGYEVRYTYSGNKVTTVQEYANGTSAGQKIGFSYYNGYTEVRNSGSDDIYGNSDDIYTRYVFDDEGRAITSYSTNISKNEIYGVSSGEYENNNEYAKNNLKVFSTTGNTSANYLLNGSFEKSDSSPTYWFTTGSVRVLPGSVTGWGQNNLIFNLSVNQKSSIYQYVKLNAGDYTLSLDINTFHSDNLKIKLIAQSVTDSSRLFEKEVPYNNYYAAGQTAFDFFTFTSNDNEIFKISVEVTCGKTVTDDSEVSIDNVMLAKSNGAQSNNMVQNGNFETTSVYSNGNTRYSPATFWKKSSDSASSSISIAQSENPFYSSLSLAGTIGKKQVAEQVVYSASSQQLALFSQGYGGSMEPQVFKVSGFGRATSIMHNSNAKFSLRLDVTYYVSDSKSETVSQYYNFCEDTNYWQYVSGTFVVPEYKKIKEIKVCCEYSGNVGVAYFDNISVIYDSEGATTQYSYDERGRTVLSINGGNVTFYSYDSNDNLHEKITKKSRTVYSYDSYGRLLTESYYTYSGYLAYLAEYNNMINCLGTQTLKMKSSYVYNVYGLLTKSTVTSPQESTEFVTQTTYNVSSGSKIFGAINTTTDSLGKITRYFYDTSNGRLLANIQPDGNGVCYSYDTIGNLISVQPATYSSATWSKVLNSADVSYQYNALNQLASISTNNTVYSFTYDKFGNKNSVSIGDTQIASQTYNNYNGKIKSVTYANGTIVSYTYDKLDRISKMVYNNSGVEYVYEYKYDSNGNLNEFIDHTSQKITLYKYDDSGRMTNFLEYDSSKNENLSSAWYVYDEHSRIDMIFYAQDYQYNNSSEYYDLSYYLSYFYNENDSINEYHVNSGKDNLSIKPTYDGHNRVTSKTVKLSNGSAFATDKISYEYMSSGTKGSVVVTKYVTQVNTGTIRTYNYTYDSANANITKIADASGTILNQYTYDALGRLTREDNSEADRTYLYTYDTDGNILTKKTYGFTTVSGTPTTTLYSTYNYSYGNNNWGDQLTAYRGQSITYDEIGNPLSYYNGSRIAMTWINGNNLASITKGSVITNYTYNDSGVRIGKTVGGVEHKYLLDGSVILSEEYDGKLFIYLYDENGAPIGIKYRENSYDADVFDNYLFEKNLQGDITGIYTEQGQQVVWYRYDAWGNRTGGSWVVNDKDIYKNLFYANPFRYRGYYQDSETGFYYCGNRYYDPVTGRFINADSTNTLMNTPMAYTDKNLYAYCDNNPVMRVDNGGEFWDTVFDVVSLCFSVVDVIQHPDDPWAWVGLAADVVSLAVPFATGGGTVVKAVSKADDVIDLAKTADKVGDAVDTVTDIGKVVGKVDDVKDATKAASNIGDAVKNGKRFTQDQQAVIDLGREAFKNGGINASEADILWEWAEEYGLSAQRTKYHAPKFDRYKNGVVKHIKIHGLHIDILN